MDHPAALHRLQVGVPATVEHSSEAGPETGKWVAETKQVSTIHCAFCYEHPHPFTSFVSLLLFISNISRCSPTPYHFLIISISALPFSPRHSDFPYPHHSHSTALFKYFIHPKLTLTVLPFNRVL